VVVSDLAAEEAFEGLMKDITYVFHIASPTPGNNPVLESVSLVLKANKYRPTIMSETTLSLPSTSLSISYLRPTNLQR
jgi:hypothetical protein